MQIYMAKSINRIQYRNAIYYGQLTDFQRHGKGMLITDNSEIILGDWQNNLINGPYVIITTQLYAHGNMRNNMLQGYNIISIVPNDRRKQQKTIYASFRSNKIYGKVITIDDGWVNIAQFASNQIQQIIKRQRIRDKEPYQALKTTFPSQFYTLEESLMNFFKGVLADLNSVQESSRYSPIIEYYDNLKFYGYLEHRNNKVFGFTLADNELLSVGQYSERNLDGIGRMIYLDGLDDGIFKQGVLHETGIKYNKNTDNFQIFWQKENSEQGYGFPYQQIRQLRKEFHLRSVYFYNDIAMVVSRKELVKLTTETLQSVLRESQQNHPNVTLAQKHTRETSRSGTKKREPLQQRLLKYEMETEEIEDPLPIHKMVQQYKPIDRRTQQYLFQAEQEERLKKQHNQNDRMRGQRGKSQIKSNKQEQYKSRPNNRFDQQKQRNTLDTRELVKNLDEEQQRRRVDLDKIYKVAGLYSRH